MGDSPLASLRCKSRCGMARLGAARCGSDYIVARPCGLARLSLTISALRASALSAGFYRNPDVWRGDRDGQLRSNGAEWHAPAQHGKATAADGSTGGFGSHCCSLWRADVSWSRFRHGVVWPAMGMVLVKDWRGPVQGKDCRRQYGGFSLPTVLSGTGMAWSGEQRPARNEIW
jgi:hypothetical protein